MTKLITCSTLNVRITYGVVAAPRADHKYSTISHLIVMFGQEDMVVIRPVLQLPTPCLSLNNFWNIGSMEVLWSRALSEALRALEAMRAAATELVVARGLVRERPRSDELKPTTPNPSEPLPLPRDRPPLMSVFESWYWWCLGRRAIGTYEQNTSKEHKSNVIMVDTNLGKVPPIVPPLPSICRCCSSRNIGSASLFSNSKCSKLL